MGMQSPTPRFHPSYYHLADRYFQKQTDPGSSNLTNALPLTTISGPGDPLLSESGILFFRS